ncbi:MAG TPA: threonine synthase [Stellaceae bacterium]|nr:threonine synthase [Stellaceae bacterium]
MNRVKSGDLRTPSYATTLLCWTCRRAYEAEKTRLLCDCGAPLEQQYDIDRMVKDGHGGKDFVAEGPGIWRYARLLPAQGAPVTMQEGQTPVIPLAETGRRLGIRLYVKDEGRNPTGTFKARGASVGVTRLRELGWTSLAMPTVGSGGSAWAAYAARAGLRMRVGLPVTPAPPRIGLVEPPIYGARTTQHDGRTEDAFAAFRASLSEEDAFLGGLREPYRVEGEKTVMFEIAEQFDSRLPDFVIWPTGGAPGLIGLAKAYEELSRCGAVPADAPPTIVSAQHASAAPIAVALRDGASTVVPGKVEGIAPGVWVGNPFAAPYILERMRATVRVDGGTGTDAEIRSWLSDVGRHEGLLLSPEGALTLAALEQLRRGGRIPSGATVVCVNTATGLRYPHLLEQGPPPPPI